MLNLIKEINVAELFQHMCYLLEDHEKLKCNKEVIKLMNYVRDHQFNQIHINGSVTTNSYMFINQNPFAQVLLRYLLVLSCLEEKFVICSSNAAHLLNASGLSFNNMNLSGIRLEVADLSGGSFIRTNLEGSRMRSVKITSADFTESNLKYIDWQDIEVKEVQRYKGHTNFIFSVTISPSGEFLASGKYL